MSAATSSRVRPRTRCSPLVLAAMFLAAACSGERDENASDTLVVWINSDKGYRGLEAIGQEFTRRTGVPVVVEHPQEAPSKFQQAASSGKGPDIFIWPHDRLGEWQAGGLISEVQPSPHVVRALEDKGWEAFTAGGRIWGYPIAFEAVGLLYNRALVPEPPARVADIHAIHARLEASGKRAILWEFGKVYFSFGLLAAHGGYPFKRRDDGSYDASDLGIEHPGAARGLRAIVDLIDAGIMPKTATYNDAESALAAGDLAMMIGGAWSWGNLATAGIDLGVAPLPAVGDQPSRPFVGVLGAMINQSSPRKDLAVEFIEHYLLDPELLRLVDDDKPIGVPAHKALYAELARDPRIHATMLSVRDGLLMPNNPEMGGFWGAMDTALENATQGRQSPEEALRTAAMRIRKSQ